MGESIIVRKGGSGGKVEKRLITEIIMANQNWIVPKGIVDNSVHVRVFGGGQAGSNSMGGGNSGCMNNTILTLLEGQSISVTIGSGGIANYAAGGTTFFGSYLSANGGGTAGGGAGGGSWVGGNGLQFGGGGGSTSNGGEGGTWGGGGGCGGGSQALSWGHAGNGGWYGGGGGDGSKDGGSGSAHAGNGGYYGGGGAASVCIYNNNYIRLSGVPGIGGWYNNNGTWMQSGLAGNGGKAGMAYKNSKGALGNTVVAAQSGTNTLGWTNIFHDGNQYFNGAGLAGNIPYYDTSSLSGYCLLYTGPGGGGFGGNGGVSILNINSTSWQGPSFFYNHWLSGGGGGGYGSNGGTGYGSDGGGGGGGGGFGGDGGNATYEGGGGGGGYGKSAKGGDNCGGGGGFYAPGGSHYGGGGGYGLAGAGGSWTGSGSEYYIALDGGIAAGGGAPLRNISGKGGNGICIIEYFVNCIN